MTEQAEYLQGEDASAGERCALVALSERAGSVLASCGSSVLVELELDRDAAARPRGASGPGAGKPAVTIGDKNFAEENILGQLYAQALQAKGYTITLKENVGSSEIIYKALTSGQIEMYPEYTGTLLSAIAEQTKEPASAAAAYAAGEGVRRKNRLHAARLHAVLRLRRAGHAAELRERAPPLEHRRPEAARQEGDARRRRRNSRRASRVCSA